MIIKNNKLLIKKYKLNIYMETVVSLNENPLEIQSQLKVFLDKHFDFVYNHNGFFIVGKMTLLKILFLIQMVKKYG